ncbi:MAG: GGDEF domain-containing protein [Propionivibrio sp.]
MAVIDGFWHDEYLRKNLKNPQITRTSDIIESLRLLRDGKVDYMIENPTVVEFYINGLGFTDLVKRGSTSKDSFVYFGVNRRQPELASIIDKVLPLINFDEMKYVGLQSVPTLRNEESRQLGSIVIGLAFALAVILFVTVRIVRSLSDQKAQTRFLKEREQLLYTDVLTGFHNRNYFSHNSEALQKGGYPQAILVADLNNLKRVNDAYGHAAGDALLRLFASYIRELFPEGDAFRIGGDEFIILLDRTSKEAAVKAIEALQSSCQACGHTVKDGQVIYPSAAMGYAIRNHDQERLDDLIARADERMYQAKARMKKRRSDHQAQETGANDSGDQ